MKYSIDDSKFEASVQEYLKAYFAARLGEDDFSGINLMVYDRQPTRDALKNGSAKLLSPAELKTRLESGGPIFVRCDKLPGDSPVAFMLNRRTHQLCSGQDLLHVDGPKAEDQPYNPPKAPPKPGRFARMLRTYLGIHTRSVKTYETYLTNKERYERTYKENRDRRMKELGPVLQDVKNAKSLGRTEDEELLDRDIAELLKKGSTAGRLRMPPSRMRTQPDIKSPDYTTLEEGGNLQIHSERHPEVKRTPTYALDSEADRRVVKLEAETERQQEIMGMLSENKNLRGAMEQVRSQSRALAPETEKQLLAMIQADANAPKNVKLEEAFRALNRLDIHKETGIHKTYAESSGARDLERIRSWHTITADEFAALPREEQADWNKHGGEYVDALWEQAHNNAKQLAEGPVPKDKEDTGAPRERNVNAMPPKEREAYLARRQQLREEGAREGDAMNRRGKTLEAIHAARDAKRNALLNYVAEAAEKADPAVTREAALASLNNSPAIREMLDDPKTLEKCTKLAQANNTAALNDLFRSKLAPAPHPQPTHPAPKPQSPTQPGMTRT